jgi:uncharacterized protein YwqG
MGAPKSEAEARRLVDKSKPGQRLPGLSKLIRPSIVMRAKKSRTARERGASGFSGVPDLPRGFAWPRHNDEPLACLAQIRMSDVAPFDPDGRLPHTGMLHVFYAVQNMPWGFDPADRGGAIVVWTTD